LQSSFSNAVVCSFSSVIRSSNWRRAANASRCAAGVPYRRRAATRKSSSRGWNKTAADDAKIKISGVCSDPTLGPDQKLGKIHEINQQRDDAITKLIPEKQLSAFKSCQAEREKENASRPKRTPERELGPCGGVIPGHAHDHDMAKPSK
jgi:hypothetical protein